MNSLRAFRPIIFLLILMGCSHPQNSLEQRILQKDSDMLMLCFNMSHSPDKIKSCQITAPIHESDSLIQYRNRYRFNDIPFIAEEYYSFDEYGLFEIQLDYYTDRYDFLDSLYQQLNYELTNDFGEPTELTDYLRWTTVGKSNSKIEISLSKDLDENDSLFVSLNYLEPLNEEI